LGNTLDRDATDISMALREIHSFCLQTLEELIRIEKAESGLQMLSIEYFARLDISIIENLAGDGYNYYVNEVTRFPSTLFQHEDREMNSIS
jgi:hypothetical protein